jgi:outer membrane protein assembly factor BamB
MRLGRSGRRGVASAALVALLVVAGCGGGDVTGASTSGPPRGGGAAWPAPNGDAANHRRVDGPIDAASVSRLRVAWSVPLSTAGYAATPIVVDGVAYVQDLRSNVMAIDLADGRIRWHHDFEEADIGPNGVNVVDGVVYGATQSSAFALDATTGRERWSVPLARYPGDAIDMAPGVAHETVYVSTAVMGPGAVGTLWALDARSGRARWSWQQVPSGLWGKPDVNSGGGMWHPPAFDNQGALYASIANPLPFPGAPRAGWGGSRPGPNRWTNSLAKLDARSGRVLWARQVLPHDLYDWDLEGPAILDRAGGCQLAITAGKMGIVYAFEASDGALVWRRAVGQHNGHDRDGLLALQGRFHPRLPATVLPGWWGGVETQMASDGSTLYVPVNNLPTVYDSPSSLIPPRDPMGGRGEMVALDVATGRMRWDRTLPHSPYGAATISSDLVFTTTYDGTVWALRRSDGEIVWRARLPGLTNAPVAVAGDTLIAAASVPTHGHVPRLVAYRLDGRGGGG